MEDNVGEFTNCSTIGASIISIAYGLDVQEEDDPYIVIANKALEYLDISFAGTFMVDAFPILKYVPRWVPGASFKAMGERATRALNLSIDVPYLQACKLLVSLEARSCPVKWKLISMYSQKVTESLHSSIGH